MLIHVFMTQISLKTGRKWIDGQQMERQISRQLAGRLSLSKMKYCFNTFLPVQYFSVFFGLAFMGLSFRSNAFLNCPFAWCLQDFILWQQVIVIFGMGGRYDIFCEVGEGRLWQRRLEGRGGRLQTLSDTDSSFRKVYCIAVEDQKIASLKTVHALWPHALWPPRVQVLQYGESGTRTKNTVFYN